MTDTRRILVTGGNGRLGQALAKQGCMTLSRDRLDITRPDILAQVLDTFAPSIIINAAAYTAVDAAEENEALARRINAVGAGNLAAYCAVADIPLIHISTDMVFGHGDPLKPVREHEKPNPASVYGVTKLEGENFVQEAAGRSLIARVSWLFSDYRESFISKILKIGKDRDSLSVVDDEVGRPTSADALAAQLISLAQLMGEGKTVPDILHLGPADYVSRYEWAQQIFEISSQLGGPAPQLVRVGSDHFGSSAKRPKGLVLDISRAQALISPMPSWRPASEMAVRRLLRAE